MSQRTDEMARKMLVGDYMRETQRVTEGLHHFLAAARRGDAAAVTALARWKNVVQAILGANLEELIGHEKPPAIVGPNGKEMT